MRGIPLLLLAMLGGCQVDASTLEQEVGANLAKQDYRLIVIAGRGGSPPVLQPSSRPQPRHAAACVIWMGWVM